MERLRILLLTDGIWPYVIGGMQKHSYYLCKYFARMQVEVILVHTADVIDDDVKNLNCFSESEKRYIRSVVVEMPPVRKMPGHYLLQSFRYSKEISKVMEDLPPVDFVIAKGLTSWHLLLKKHLKTPVGINIHGYEYLQKKADLRSKVEGLFLSFPLTFVNRKADFVFSYGGKITDLIRSIGVDQSRIIEATAAIEPEWLADDVRSLPGKRTFVFIGRYERRKGVHELSMVLQKAARLHDFEFHFVGPIPEDKKIHLPNIHYHGLLRDRQEIKSLLQKSHVLVCPSYSEGMPNVILEGMANGCAVIATNVGAVSLIVSEETGWLVDAANIDQLEKAFSEAVTISSDDLENKRTASYNLVKNNFLWSSVSEKLLTGIKTHLSKWKYAGN